METSLNILVVGRHEDIMETVLRLIHSQPGWIAQGAIANEEAIEKFKKQSFNLVLLGGGVDQHSENMLKTEFGLINSNCKVIRHYGGGSGLLFNEIREAMNNRFLAPDNLESEPEIKI